MSVSLSAWQWTAAAFEILLPVALWSAPIWDVAIARGRHIDCSDSTIDFLCQHITFASLYCKLFQN
jgi:hypothetical protein